MKKFIIIFCLVVGTIQSNYSQTIDLKKGLVAYYPFNGNANDESGNGNVGTTYNTELVQDRNGKVNSAYRFNGKDSYIDLNNPIAAKDLKTISFWAKFIRFDREMELVSKSSNGSGVEVILYPFDPPALSYFVSNNNDENNAITYSTLKLNTTDWFHIVATQDGPNSDMKLYVDGELVETRKTPTNISDQKNLYLGRWNNDSYQRVFDGFLDDIRLYNRALSEEEVQALYENKTDENISVTNNDSTKVREDNIPVVIEKRLALVIGNSRYTNGQILKNPANDAALMASTLQSLGFEVIKSVDATKQSMEQAIKDFSTKLPDCNVALFYYAGHGIQVDGSNYLVPIDAVLAKKEDCKFEGVEVNYIVQEFEKYPKNVNIVILDACRSNPFRSWSRGVNAEPGFKAINPTSGTIISFATSEGSTASDGSGNNGLFTEQLVKQMEIPQPIESVFKKTRVQVQKLSNSEQSPQEWSQLTGDFYFKN